MKAPEVYQSCPQEGGADENVEEKTNEKVEVLVDDIVKAQPLNLVTKGLRLKAPRIRESVLP